ncbi:MAG TPA: hypothetical protein DER58_02615 [Firmicutes bacterium]|nr:hypothetical protein [Bacillota bacterium]
MAVGGASINEDCAEKFRSLGIHVLVGYGLTECSPVVSVNRISNYKVNSCGEILSCCKVRINSERKTLPGEVLVKGSNVMAGYYLNVDETNKVFEDGWFRTGDIGHINNNILYIVGRTKNIILLKNGENVYPEEVENKIKRINSVVDAVVFDLEGLIACEVFLGEDPSEEVLNNFRREMQSYNRNVQAAKRIQKIIIRHMPFEKTKLSKIIRGNIIANKQEC